MKPIINFKSIDKGFLNMVGGKNASLGEMIKAGIRVPQGFAVTTESYLHFITKYGIIDKIYSMLSNVDVDDIKALDIASQKIRASIVRTPMSSETQTSIWKGYEELGREYHDRNIPVAVRSSATAEDLPTASFAGQQDTYLWTIGIAQVLANVKRCWASLFTSRAISYRIKNGFSHEDVLISVGIQKMVSSKTSGVMFTLNPSNGDPSKVVIEGSWGFGETVVGGYVNPDKFVVDKVTQEINERKISQKHIECVYDPDLDEVVQTDVKDELQLERCLRDEEIRELVRVAKIIEKHYGYPQDIEWSIDKDLSFPENVFIVQSRPETVWSQKKKKPILGGKSSYQIMIDRGLKRIKIK
ncbi:MAG: PEP/pyruvate-binding domain-containing protein [Fidelibacterota bacterium]